MNNSELASYWLQRAAFCGNKAQAAIFWARHSFYLGLAGQADESIHWQKVG